MEFEGTVYKIMPVTKGTSARGEWQRQDVVFEMNEGSFTRKICVTFFNKPDDVARLRTAAAGTQRPAPGILDGIRRRSLRTGSRRPNGPEPPPVIRQRSGTGKSCFLNPAARSRIPTSPATRFHHLPDNAAVVIRSPDASLLRRPDCRTATAPGHNASAQKRFVPAAAVRQGRILDLRKIPAPGTFRPVRHSGPGSRRTYFPAAGASALAVESTGAGST